MGAGRTPPPRGTSVPPTPKLPAATTAPGLPIPTLRTLLGWPSSSTASSSSSTSRTLPGPVRLAAAPSTKQLPLPRSLLRTSRACRLLPTANIYSSPTSPGTAGSSTTHASPAVPVPAVPAATSTGPAWPWARPRAGVRIPPLRLHAAVQPVDIALNPYIIISNQCITTKINP